MTMKCEILNIYGPQERWDKFVDAVGTNHGGRRHRLSVEELDRRYRLQRRAQYLAGHAERLTAWVASRAPGEPPEYKLPALSGLGPERGVIKHDGDKRSAAYKKAQAKREADEAAKREARWRGLRPAPESTP